MKKTAFQAKLSVAILKEGNRYIAFSPALDLSTSGKTAREARERFGEAAQLFFEETVAAGTLTRALGELGWKKVKSRWNPPVIISQEAQTVLVPA